MPALLLGRSQVWALRRVRPRGSPDRGERAASLLISLLAWEGAGEEVPGARGSVNTPSWTLSQICAPVPRMRACLHAQPCLTLFDPMDRSRPDSSVHGIFQARILESVAISSSRGSPPPRDGTCISLFSCTGRWATREAPVPNGALLTLGRKELS